MLNCFTLFFYLSSLALWQASQVNGSDTCFHPCINEGLCKAAEINDTCYYTFYDKKRTWNEGKVLCTSLDMTMMKLSQNMAFNGSQMKGLVDGSEEGSFAWIGGGVKCLDKWKFVKSGVSADDTNGNRTALGKDMKNMHQCGTITYSKTGDSKFWITKADCHHEYHFICRFDNWMNSLSYYMSETKTNWYDARSRCKQLGGDLFYLMKKWESFQEIVDKLKPSSTMFIGLIHRMWQWEDGEEISFYDWKYGGSSNPNGECLAMNLGESKWTEADCNESLYTICEFTYVNGTINDDGLSCTSIFFILGGLQGVTLVAIICLLLFRPDIHQLCKRKSPPASPKKRSEPAPQASINLFGDVSKEVEEMYRPPYRAEIRTVLRNAQPQARQEDADLMDKPYYEEL